LTVAAHSRRWIGGLMALLLIGIAATILIGRSRVSSVVLLPAGTSLTPKPSVIATWFSRAKEFVLGKSRTVMIDIAFVRVTPSSRPPLSFPQPVKAITNLHIYFVGTNEAARMCKHLTSGDNAAPRCRIATSEGVATKITVDQFTLELLCRGRSDGTDLLASIYAGGPVTTNLAIGGRFQIPKDQALFILKSANIPDDRATRAVILTPRWK
jgi:hypothetical protein